MLGEGKAPAKLCLALQRMASNQEDPKEAKFCNLESSKTTVKWAFAELTAAEVGPWEIHLQGPGVCSV